MAVTLSEFTNSLDPKTLPRILRIQSGYYLQGGVYELCGRECCLVTGDLIKIIGVSVTKFIASNFEATDIVLPLEYPGLFRIVADAEPYRSVQEIVDSLKVGSHRLGQPTFRSGTRIQLPQILLKEQESFRITSVIPVPNSNGGRVVCKLLHGDPKSSFFLDFSQQGPFLECDDDQFYTLQELAEWKIAKGRERTVTAAKKAHSKDGVYSGLAENVGGKLTLMPVYELQAVMHHRKNIALIPSNLDVEVVDVTEHFDLSSFIQPLSLQDVFCKPSNLFPILANVVERPSLERHSPEELDFLLDSVQVIVHQAYEAKRVLATEIRRESPRHFLIPPSYNGRLKRRPRELPTAYDLERACSETEQLHVVATRAFDSTYAGLASVLAGDEFVVKKRMSEGDRSPTWRARSGEAVGDHDANNVLNAHDALACLKMKGKSNEPVRLPMCLDGGFVEVVHDKRPYSLAEVCRWFPLPFNVKVSVRDLSIKEDILAGAPGLRIEEEITEPFLLVSNLDLSGWKEVPVNRMNMTLHLERSWDGDSPLLSVSSVVEEISEDCYYTMRRYVVTTVAPPPRPPKKPKPFPGRSEKGQPGKPEKSAGVSSSCTSPKNSQPAGVSSRDVGPDLSNSNTVGEKSAPKSPATLPKTAPLHRVSLKTATRGLSLEEVCVNRPDDDDPHDYEYIDEDELDNIRKQLHEQSISSKTKPSNTI